MTCRRRRCPMFPVLLLEWARPSREYLLSARVDHLDRLSSGLYSLCTFQTYGDHVSVVPFLELIPQLPKITNESDVLKDRFRFVECVSSPIGFQSILEPSVSEIPSLLRRHRPAQRKRTRTGPSIHVLFVPEEQHRASREPDVVPPVPRRNSAVNHTLGVL